MQDFLFVRKGARCIKIKFCDIQYIEAEKGCSKIKTTTNDYRIDLPLNRILEKLPADIFFRIHNSFIISLYHTTYFETETVFVAGKELPIGRQYRGLLAQKVILLCCDCKNEDSLSRRGINKLLKENQKN